MQRQGPHCHGRSACNIEAASAAISSPVTSSAPPCMWCTRCMQVARISRLQVLRCRPQQQQVAMGCERHAVAQVDTGASWLLALGRFRSAWPLHPLRLACVEAVSAAVDSPVTSSAPPRMWCMRRMRMVRISRPSLLRLWLEQQRIRTEAIDADTTIFVSIGARSGGIRSCGWFSRGDEPRATCSRSASYRRQLHRR